MMRRLAAVLVAPALALALAVAPGQVLAQRAFAILDKPVAVSAQPDSTPGAPPRFYAFTVTVAHDRQTYAYRTFLVAVDNLAAAVAVLRRTIGWRGGYLFARRECGGGNAWRCDVDLIFALRGGRLVRIGEQSGGTRSQAPGAAYRNGHFVDVYDRLEINDLTSHAGAPWFRIYLVDRDGRLAADLPYTWRMDVRRFESSRRELDHVVGDRKLDPRARDETIASLLLHNAALARYCRQASALDQTTVDAKRLLAPAAYARFERLVASVAPGELPQSLER
jgi:hypothetical protein